MKAAILALLLWMAPASAGAFTVPPHPRMLLTSVIIDTLRARCQRQPYSAWLATFRSQCDSRIASGRYGSIYAPFYAFCWLMTSQASYKTAAITALVTSAQNGDGTGQSTMEGEGPGRISPLALGYDWMYRDMTPADRATVGNSMVWCVVNNKSRNDGHPWLPTDQYLPFPLAIYGDGYADADAADGLQKAYDEYMGTIASLNEVGPYGALDGYDAKRTYYMITMAELLRTGIGIDVAQQSGFIRNGSFCWMSRLRGDLTRSRVPGKWNPSDYSPDVFFPYWASRFPTLKWAPWSQWMAAKFLNYDSSGEAWTRIPYKILWYKAWLPATQPDSLSFYDPGAGMVFARNTWAFADSTIHFSFFNGPDLTLHKSQNHFMIARGADALVAPSGSYHSDEDDHWVPYYTRAVSHNTILIDDSNEDLGGYTNWLGKRHTMPNEGEQLGSDLPAGLVRWPASHGTYGYRGEIPTFVDAGSYVYTRGEDKEAYGSKTAYSMTEFVYVRPDLIVRRDRVKTAFPVRSVIHFVQKPIVSGTPTTVYGSWAHGGVFTSTSIHSGTAKRGKSKLAWNFLGPGTLTIVGGENANGAAWKQNIDPSQSLTYDSSQSYEFWVDGVNWCPGQYLTQGDIDGRNATSGNEASAWRVEFEPPASADTTSLVCAMVAQDSSAVAPVILQTAAGNVDFVRAPGDTVEVRFAPHGWFAGVRRTRGGGSASVDLPPPVKPPRPPKHRSWLQAVGDWFARLMRR